MTYASILMTVIGICCFILFLSALGQRYELMPWKVALGLFALSLLAAFICGCVGAVFLLKSLGSHTQANIGLMASTLIGLLPLVALLVIIGPASFFLPKIHDISTDLESPPTFTHALSLRRPTDNTLALPTRIVREQQAAAYGDLQPLKTSLDFDRAFEQSLVLAQQLGWQVTYQDRDRGVFEAVVETAFLNFKDDVVVRVRGLRQGSQIDLRSVSRIGVSDLGANAKRIRSFIVAFPDD